MIFLVLIPCKLHFVGEACKEVLGRGHNAGKGTVTEHKPNRRLGRQAIHPLKKRSRDQLNRINGYPPTSGTRTADHREHSHPKVHLEVVTNDIDDSSCNTATSICRFKLSS